MANVTLTNSDEFKQLATWAKACALAQQSTELEPEHFLYAAWYLAGAGKIDLPRDVRQALDSWVKNPPAIAAPNEAQKMPTSSALRAALAASDAMSVADWLRTLLGKTSPASTEQPAGHGPEWTALAPWVRSAMRVHAVAEVNFGSLALAVVRAVEEQALKDHTAFAHFCQAHADELLAYLEHAALYQRGLEPDLTEISGQNLVASEDLRDAIKAVDEDAHAPNTTWRWLQAAVTAANRYNRQLQVAYHEAGHAVALHILRPESSFKTITIVPKGDAAGYVAPTQNEGYDAIYRLSLEFTREEVVVDLAGRAAETKKYGTGRGDSGAVQDYTSATRHAWMAITAFGLDPVFGPINLGSVQTKYSDSDSVTTLTPNGWLQDLAQKRLHAWMQWGQEEATRVIDVHWALVEKLALELMAKKTLSDQEARSILGALAVGSEFRLKELPLE